MFRQATLTSLADYINGHAFKPEDLGREGLPVIRIEQLKDRRAPFDYSTRMVPPRNIIENDDLLFSWSASLFLQVWDRGKALLNQHLFKVIPRPQIDKQFLKYCIEFNLPALALAAHGSTMQHVTRKELQRFRVLIPITKLEQEQIATVLLAVDRMIQRTEALIEKRNRIKNGLMQDLLTRGIDEQGTLRNRMTHKFKSSRVGLIPLQWDEQNLSGLAEPKTPICYGIVQVREFVSGGVPTLAIHDLAGDYHTNVHCTAPSIEVRYSRSRVQSGDLLISVKGTTGRVDVAPAGFVGNISRDLARIRFKATVCPQFYKFYFQSQLGMKVLDSVTVGTTRKEISIAPLQNIRVPVPPKTEQEAIAGVLEAHQSMQKAEHRRLMKLLKLKKGLMHDLLNNAVSIQPLLEADAAVARS